MRRQFNVDNNNAIFFVAFLTLSCIPSQYHGIKVQLVDGFIVSPTSNIAAGNIGIIHQKSKYGQSNYNDNGPTIRFFGTIIPTAKTNSCQNRLKNEVSSLLLYSSSSSSSSPTVSSSTSSSTQNENNDDDDDDENSSQTLFFANPKVKELQRKYETYRWKYKSGFDNSGMNGFGADGNSLDNKIHKNNAQKMDENSSSYPDTYYNINYRVDGPIGGIPVLLVHGFGANVNHFRYQFPALCAAGYRVYAIDLIGFGASDKPICAPPSTATTNHHSSNDATNDRPFGYCIELFSELIRDFIVDIDNNENQSTQHQQRRRWMIAGNSIGGLCCLSVAATIPDKIQSVTLFNCAGGMTGFRYSELPWFISPILYFVQNVLLGPYFGPRFFTNFKSRKNIEQILKQQGVYCDPRNVDDELLEILLGPADDAGAENVFLQVFGGPPGPIPEDILPNVQCPILAIWGGKDPWTPVDYGLHPGNAFGQYNPNYTLHVLPDTGHCPHDERPDQVNAIMIPWLQSIQATTTTSPNE
jgi:pimeloyl-ACP methyl ester carboxylesterase